MSYACDVNVIFSYSNRTNPCNKSAIAFVNSNTRQNHILLDKVKTSFIKTYSYYLKLCCQIVVNSVLAEKEVRSKAPSTTYKPSPNALSSNIRAKIKDRFYELSEQSEFNSAGAKIFLEEMLSNHSIPKLYAEEKAIGEFREDYLIKAETQAKDILNKFLKRFKKRMIMKLIDYTSYNLWMKNIKKCNAVFHNHKDHEDEQIAAEYLSYNKDIGVLKFVTFDKEFARSIPIVSKRHNQKTGKITLLRKK